MREAVPVPGTAERGGDGRAGRWWQPHRGAVVRGLVEDRLRVGGHTTWLPERDVGQAEAFFPADAATSTALTGMTA